jgi:multicomponent Na+:H+ antiporter subunit D
MLAFFAIVPVFLAVLLYIIPHDKFAKVLIILAQAGLTCAAFFLFLETKNGAVITNIGNFEYGMGIVLKADNISAVFVLLTSFMFCIAAIYSFNERSSRLFWFFLFIWEGLLNGIFLSGDMFNVFVLFEVVTIIVAVLIMFNRDKRSMYDGIVYLMISIVAMQFFLFGVGYVYKITGVLDMDAAAEIIQTLDKQHLALPYALIMTTIALKCALIPLYSWLQKAHSTPGAPSAVSAILSGLHVKAGLYLFIRFQHIFSEVYISEVFLVIGIITGIGGFLFALAQTDIKLILAYHTISQIGMIMVGLNLPGSYAYTGSVYHIVNHALFKSGLFLCAGIIASSYGTRDITKIKGVFKRLPLVGVAMVMAVFGIAGAPFFNGSISKYFIMDGAGMPETWAIILINLGTIISFIKFTSMLFGKPEKSLPDVKIETCRQEAVLVLGVMCFAGGLFGRQFIQFLFNTTVSVDAAGYMQKSVIFIFSGIVGYFIYNWYVKHSRLFKRLRAVEFSFRFICGAMGAFFAFQLLMIRVM